MNSIIKNMAMLWWIAQGAFLAFYSIKATIEHDQPIVKWDLLVGICLVIVACLHYLKYPLIHSIVNWLILVYAIAFVVLISTVVIVGHVSSDLTTKLYVIAFLNFLMSLITFRY